MKTRKITGYQDLTPIKIKLAEYLQRARFEEFVLGYIEEHPIPQPDRFRAALLSFLKTSKPCAYSAETLSAQLAKFPRLTKDVELGRALAGKVIELLGVEGSPDPAAEISVDAKQFLRAYLHIFYYIAKSLEAVMPKKEAVKYFQDLMDTNTRNNIQLAQVKNVSELVFDDSVPKGAFKDAFLTTEFILDEGRSGCRVDKCKWAEVMKEMNDPDFAYAVACHYDFEAAIKHNPAFKLTRNGTLTQGKPYCDFLWHDTRVDKDLAHPPQEFWEGL